MNNSLIDFVKEISGVPYGFYSVTKFEARCSSCGIRELSYMSKEYVVVKMRTDGWAVVDDEIVCPMCLEKRGEG